MGILYLILIFVGMYFVCVELERACADTAFRFGIPESIAGATLLAVASSAPEFFTSFLGAVIHGVFDVGLIAILWSAIFNVTVLPGASALVSPKPLKVVPTVIKRDCVAYAATALLLLGLIEDGTLSQIDALILLGGYGLYVYVLFLMIGSKEGEDTEEGDEEDHSQPLWRTIAGLVVGIAAIGVLCHFMIEVGGDLAESFGISFLLVSALVFAPGTSLPDLLLSTISARKGAGSASISNAFGSNSFDLTVCLAAPVLVVGDIQVQTGGTITWSVWMLLGTVALTMFVVRTGYELTKLEGAILVGTFVVLAVTQDSEGQENQG
ncbi:MAG: sodium:calcium antiporter, partial [Myxococcota bacterium]